jgi:magnesium chelatase family protein
VLSKLYTATLVGLDCKIIEAELDYRKGDFHFAIVGLADKSVQEAKDRVPSALRSSGAAFVPMRIIVNLAPAELHKSGPSYDLPLAMAFLIASDQIQIEPEGKIFIGELALDGRLRPVKGVLPITDAVKKLGFKEIYLPLENANEGSLVTGIDVYGVESLKDIMNHFNGVKLLKPYVNSKEISEVKEKYKFDLSQVKGQEYAKRALEIAAAGSHNILFSGVPGSGKTMISRTLPSILPLMELEESLEVTRIYSVAGLTSREKPMVKVRPFRSPHHTSSQVALVGGGAYPKPGEISLAHRGVLFLDEFPEFSSQALEALRQPLEDRVVTISRAQGTLSFPANFILAAAMNPCKCGYKGDPDKSCTCNPLEVIKYQKKISGPILDRIDLLVRVQKVENNKLLGEAGAESSESVKKRVQQARDIQVERFKNTGIFSNSDMTQKDIEKFVKLDEESTDILNLAVSKLNLSARSYFRVLRVARTIADLFGEPDVQKKHIAEGLGFRVDIG